MTISHSGLLFWATLYISTRRHTNKLFKHFCANPGLAQW